MAGIGFELKKLLDHETFFSDFLVYRKSTLYSSGPWLIPIIILIILWLVHTFISSFAAGEYDAMQYFFSIFFILWLLFLPIWHTLITMVGLFLLLYSSGSFNIQIDRNEYEFFMTVVIYIYAFSLIMPLSLQHLISTRYLADQIFEDPNKQPEETAAASLQLLSTFLPSLILLLIGGIIISATIDWLLIAPEKRFFLYPFDFFIFLVGCYLSSVLLIKKYSYAFPLTVTAIIFRILFSVFWTPQEYYLFVFAAVLLFLTVSVIWLCMIFLHAVKDYMSVIHAFGVCLPISIIASMFLGLFHQMGTEGYLIGFLIGQFLTMCWLLSRLITEYLPLTGFWDNNFVLIVQNIARAFLLTPFYPILIILKRKGNVLIPPECGKFWELFWIGLFYNLGIWIDKIIFWFQSPESFPIIWHGMKTGFIRNNIYEPPLFLAYLTIIPTFAILLLKIETQLYEHYRRYFSKVLGKKDLASILEEKNLMISAIHDGIREVLIFQGTVSLLSIVYLPEVLGMAGIGFEEIHIHIFRYCTIGAFLNGLVLCSIIILFYFDLRACSIVVTGVFMVSNGLFSYLTTFLGAQFYGIGYISACLISVMIALYFLNDRIQNWEYITFAGQSVI